MIKKCMKTALKGKGSGLSGLSGTPKKRVRRKGGGYSGLSAGMKKQQNKMSSCAAKWRNSGKTGKYKNFMSKCLKG